MDFRDFAPGSEKSTPPDGSGADTRWWEKSGAAQAGAISSTLANMNRAQTSRIGQIVTNARLYGAVPSIGPSGISFARYGAMFGAQRDRLTYNAVQSAIDTVIAKLCKSRPKPFFLTSGGDSKTQRKAKKLNQFVEGVFYALDVYEKGELCARDAAVYGDGLLHIHERNGRVVADRAMLSEFWVDEREAQYGEPRQMHRVTEADRGVLERAFKGKATEIEKAIGPESDSARGPSVADVVMVRESWRLPSGPEAKDGKHVISLAGAVLFSEKWEHDFFPFARMSWCRRDWGFWAQGAAEQIAPTQIEINKLNMTIQRAHQLSGSFVIFLENGSKVVKAHLDNEIGRIVNYTGTKPEYETPPICPPELYQQLENLIKRAYELVGVSQLSAVSQKPEGLNSGKALREMNDIESDRFNTISKAYERFYLQAARIAIAVSRGIAKGEGRYEVSVPGKKFLKTIDWKSIDLEEDDYTMQCFPISSLPSDPAGRLQTVQEYIQAGMIPLDVGQKLLEFPDLQQFETLNNAMEDRLQEILDGIVDDGEYEEPQPYYNLKRAKELVLQYIVLGESQHLDEERLEMLHRFNDQLDAYAQAAQQAQQQQMAQAQMMAQLQSGGGPPQAAPNPPPQSDLIPNSPAAAA